MAILSYRSLDMWLLGYPDAASADAARALEDARDFGQSATLLYALANTMYVHICRRDNVSINEQSTKLVALADEMVSSIWHALGTSYQGFLLARTNRASEAIEMITSGFTAYNSTGATVLKPLHFSFLARAYAELGQLQDAWRIIHEAMTAARTTKENWWGPELKRIAGELVLMAPQPDFAKALAYFQRALHIARVQQAKSLELRAANSMARLCHVQGNHHEAYELLAPAYAWFKEGFDTPDLKEARDLLNTVSS